jgi:hypothetical protein
MHKGHGQSASAVPARRRLLDHVGLARIEEIESIGLQLGYRYENSPVCVGDRAPILRDGFESYVPAAVPGARAPHAVLDDGIALYDRFGKWFTLLRLGGSKVSISTLERSAAKYCVPLTFLDVLREDVKALFKKDLVLVRPDHHISWCGDELPDDVDGLVNCICGANNSIHLK